MNLRSPLNRLLLAIGALAVLCTQLFGIGSGFLCDCAGQPVFTTSDHCHGPHGAHCHVNVEPSHLQKSDPDRGDTRSHDRVARGFQSTPAFAAGVVPPEPLLHVVFVLDRLPCGDEVAPLAALRYAADERGSPPFSVAVSRTVVLLI